MRLDDQVTEEQVLEIVVDRIAREAGAQTEQIPQQSLKVEEIETDAPQHLFVRTPIKFPEDHPEAEEKGIHVKSPIF